MGKTEQMRLSPTAERGAKHRALLHRIKGWQNLLRVAACQNTRMSGNEKASSSPGRNIVTEFVTVYRNDQNKPVDLTIQVVDMRQIARGNYVVSRVSLVCGYTIAGCLLAHQSIEMYLKGIIRAYGRTERGHDLRRLVSAGVRLGIPGLDPIAKNKDQMTLLKELCSVYDTLRFSEESGYVIDNKNIVLFLDEIALDFERMYAEKLNEANPLHVYVHETMKDRFLKFNDYFGPEMVTNDSRAKQTTNVKEIPNLPPEVGRRVFTVTDILLRGLTGPPPTVGHYPKRVPKEELRTGAATSVEAPANS